MILYFTFNDLPSGIYSSQVIDVIKFMRAELKTDIRLLAFISVRGFYKNKKKIRQLLPDAIVIPMFPGVHRWKSNTFLLHRVVNRLKPEKIICRSVLATSLAFKVKEKSSLLKIVYDGRGAIAAEWKEYGVVTHPGMLKEISSLEKEAVIKSDYRIAVSEKLVEFWRSEYSYAKNDHVIIPCTLNRVFTNTAITEKSLAEARAKLGIQDDSIVFAYSGSLAGWQSLSLFDKFVKAHMGANPKLHMLFLSMPHPVISSLTEEFPGRVICMNTDPSNVPQCLLAADYGLLIREESVTNLVASPVKFAEYLACGLKVLISENLGDYSSFIKTHHCGYIYSEFNNAVKTNSQEKEAMRSLALQHFTKENYFEEYKKLAG